MMPTPLPLLRCGCAAIALSFAAHAGAAAPGGLTRDQFIARQTDRILAADTDGDGTVSRAELAAMAKGARDPSRRFDAMDGDHDGTLDKAEITKALTARFDRMDRNGDGTLAPDERMAGRRAADAAAPARP